MTEFAFDSAGPAREAQAPISRHPAFPAIVAAWLAVLLGAGSLIVPAVLLERALEVAGASALVPPAAAPLGPTARGLVALVATLSGALAGLAIARFIIRPREGADRDPEQLLAPDARRPISAFEELGGDHIAGGFDWSDGECRAPAPAEDGRAVDAAHQAVKEEEEEEDAETAIVEDLTWAGDPLDSTTTRRVADPCTLPTPLEMSDPTVPDSEPLYFSPPSLSRRAALPGTRVRAGAGARPALVAGSDVIGTANPGRDRATAARPLVPPSNPAETDAALREALRTLQRVSGTA